MSLSLILETLWVWGKMALSSVRISESGVGAMNSPSQGAVFGKTSGCSVPMGQPGSRERQCLWLVKKEFFESELVRSPTFTRDLFDGSVVQPGLDEPACSATTLCWTDWTSG